MTSAVLIFFAAILGVTVLLFAVILVIWLLVRKRK